MKQKKKTKLSGMSKTQNMSNCCLNYRLVVHFTHCTVKAQHIMEILDVVSK